ncbi:MAG: hypothetical protein MHM6MM_000009 [Cercozoa sp. M6MM]
MPVIHSAEDLYDKTAPLGCPELRRAKPQHLRYMMWFRVTVCNEYLKGNCDKGYDCFHSHFVTGSNRRRRQPYLMTNGEWSYWPNPCRNLSKRNQNKRCEFGDRCRFATQLCPHPMIDGRCRDFGTHCGKAHGLQDLRTPPPKPIPKAFAVVPRGAAAKEVASGSRGDSRRGRTRTRSWRRANVGLEKEEEHPGVVGETVKEKESDWTTSPVEDTPEEKVLSSKKEVKPDKTEELSMSLRRKLDFIIEDDSSEACSNGTSDSACSPPRSPSLKRELELKPVAENASA